MFSEHLPEIILVGVLVVAVLYKTGRIALPLSFGSPASEPPPFVPSCSSAGEPPRQATAAEMFAAAHRMARHEAELSLDAKMADAAQKAVVAIYQAPFSPPGKDAPAS